MPLPIHSRLTPCLIAVAAACAAFAALRLAADPAPPIGWTTPARIVRVIDGDTVEVEITRRIHVRMNDCWAPESRTRDDFEKTYGLAAKGQLTELCAGRNVILNIPASERGELSDVFTMSRVVGTIWLDDPTETLSLNDLMIRGGFAWPTKAEQIAAIEAKRNPTPAKEGNNHESDRPPGQTPAGP